MQDAQNFRQAVCESRKSDRVVKFLTADQFTEAIQKMMDNGDVYGAYFEKSGALVIEDRDGRKHYNVLADGSHARPVGRASWLVVQPMSGADLGSSYKSKASAKDALEAICDTVGVRYSQAVTMTARQWERFKAAAQRFTTEDEQRAAVSKIVGYDY